MSEELEEMEVQCADDCGAYFTLMPSEDSDDVGEINGTCPDCGCQADHRITGG